MSCGNQRLNKTPALSIPAVLLLVSLGLSQESSPLSEQVLQDAYSAHLKRVRKMLPPHSGLPPLLDLSKSALNDAAKDRAWERMFNGTMGTRVITDPGAPRLSQVTSVATTFIDTVGRPAALPAQECDAVLIAKAFGSDVRFAHTHTYVYSLFSLEVSQVLKRNNKARIREGEKIVAVQLGGRILFPSGHMETFILAAQGFLEVGREYVIFIWKPAKSIDTYIASETYLIQGDLVFPINTVADVSAYEGMPLKDFEAKVRAAISKNVNTD